MSDRGMKKWAPYKSLVEQAPSLDHTFEKDRKVEMPQISTDVMQQINDVLVNYHGQDVKIKYWKKGHIYEDVVLIKIIDVNNKKIVVQNGTTIYFKELLYLEDY